MNELFELDQLQKKAIIDATAARDNLLSSNATRSCKAMRRVPIKPAARLTCSNDFIVDVERILYNPLYNRSADKTQVFSFYRNDDLTRRALHVQLVSRIARNIGQILQLNTDLIEAIALGHDIGHAPFGHEGERILNRLYNKYNKSFNHNVQSVKILEIITNKNKMHGLTLQTLDGILCHNGEKVHEHYEPAPMLTFEQFDERFSQCYTNSAMLKQLRPCTMEGCVVRVSDIIAYVGKDRSDLIHANKGFNYDKLSDDNILGKSNSDIVGRLVNNIIKNSMGKNYLSFDRAVYDALDSARNDNFEVIYKQSDEVIELIDTMASKLFDKFIADICNNNRESSVYKHYINNPIIGWSYFADKKGNVLNDNVEECDIVIDYMASMTDDYFIDIFKHYFSNETALISSIKYVPYDDGLK